jgi:hypothetical protein
MPQLCMVWVWLVIFKHQWVLNHTKQFLLKKSLKKLKRDITDTVMIRKQPSQNMKQLLKMMLNS